MGEEKDVLSIEWGGGEVRVESGELGKEGKGGVVVRQGDRGVVR